MKEITQAERDAIYKKWEDWYSILGLDIKNCFKWLRDYYVSLMSGFVDKGENIIVDGCFRSGKSSLGVYFGKLKELGRSGKMKTVGYIDMIEIDKNKDIEEAWSPDFNFETVEREASKEIIMLDELYYVGSLEKITYPLIERYRGVKMFVILLHSDLRYNNTSIMRNLKVLKAKTIVLHSYSKSEEDMILRKLDATDEQADWLKDNLNGNRVLYNILMHRFFDENISVEEAINMYSQGFIYNTPYFIQDNFKNISIIKKAAKGKKLNSREKQRLFDFGILSLRKICNYDEISIPSPIIRKVAPNRKINKALMLD